MSTTAKTKNTARIATGGVSRSEKESKERRRLVAFNRVDRAGQTRRTGDLGRNQAGDREGTGWWSGQCTPWHKLPLFQTG